MRDEETGTGFAEAKLSEILRFGRVAPSLRMTPQRLRGSLQLR